jgi:FkbM family methyltransferase
MSSNEYCIALASRYGNFMMDKFDEQQPAHIQAHGIPHIYEEIDFVTNIVDKLPEDSVFVDVGGNIGLFSIPVAKKLSEKNGKVYTFEAQRIFYYMLAGNVALNNLTNMYAYNLAVSDKEEWLQIPLVDYFSKNDFGTVTFKDTPSVDGTFIGQDKVKTVVLDNLGLNRLDMMKIDVEGMEMNVLQGAKQSILKFKPLIFIEYFLAKPEDGLQEFFVDLGYNIFVADRQNWLCIPKEKTEYMPKDLVQVA